MLCGARESEPYTAEKHCFCLCHSARVSVLRLWQQVLLVTEHMPEIQKEGTENRHSRSATPSEV